MTGFPVSRPGTLALLRLCFQFLSEPRHLNGAVGQKKKKKSVSSSRDHQRFLSSREMSFELFCGRCSRHIACSMQQERENKKVVMSRVKSHAHSIHKT